MADEFVNINTILPEKLYTNADVKSKKQENNLVVFYENKYPTGKLKTERFQPKKAIIPSKIKIDSLLIEGCGLYQGDGQKSIKSKSYQVLKFSNSNLAVILFFLDFLQQKFNIKLQDLNGCIRAGTALRGKVSEEEMIQYWAKNTKIPREKFYKVGWNKSKYEDSKAEPYGNLSVLLQNSSFRLVFDALFVYIKKQAVGNKQHAADFLRGLLAADGNVYYNKTSKLREVNIAAKEETDRIFIRKLFHKVGMQPNKDNVTVGKETVRITGLPNFKIFGAQNMHTLHPEKKRKFEQLIVSYKNECYRKGKCIGLVEDLLQKKAHTVYQLADRLHRKPNAIRRYLKILESKSRVRRELATRFYETGRVAETWSIFKSRRRISIYSEGL